jgi:hypothetical protein
MIQLSYSTINMLYQASHNWINKQIGLRPEEKAIYQEGKKAHDIIERHLSGKECHPQLVHLNFSFPIVEEKDFDERLKFNIELNDSLLKLVDPRDPRFYQPKDSYNIIGFADGLNQPAGYFLEIKTSSVPWTIKKFFDSEQRKLYALGFAWANRAICISGQRDPAKWATEKVKAYSLPCTPKDHADAILWVLGGIKIIESGDYTGGLVDGKCVDPNCYYGINCHFR